MRFTILIIFALCASLLLPLAVPGARALDINTVDVSGSVIGAGGSPFQGVNVTAVNTTTEKAFSGFSDQSGIFNMSLPQGTYNFSAFYSNYISNVTYTDMIVAGSTSNLNFTMIQTTGTVTGFVTNGTTPIKGAKIFLSNDLNSYNTTSSSPVGQFIISGVVPGSYIVYAEKGGYETEFITKPIVVHKAETVTTNLTLAEQQARLDGRVTQSGNGVSSVLVTLTSEDGAYSNYTDGSGNYLFNDVPSGTYTITFSKDGYDSYNQSVTLSSSQGNTLNVPLKREKVIDSQGFFPGYDLPHSLMIVGLSLALVTLFVALVIKFRSAGKPPIMPENGDLK